MYFKNGYYIKGNYFNKFLSSMLFPCKIISQYGVERGYFNFFFYTFYTKYMCSCVWIGGNFISLPFPSKSTVFLTTAIIINQCFNLHWNFFYWFSSCFFVLELLLLLLLFDGATFIAEKVDAGAFTTSFVFF